MGGHVTTETQSQVAVRLLGMPGRMISGSKSGYDRAHPGHVVVFNANICTRSNGKIWYGDLDITKDEAMLKALAEALGEDVFVLSEHDARFETAAAPRFDRARAIASASDVSIKERV
jgi:hypothetical protein